MNGRVCVCCGERIPGCGRPSDACRNLCASCSGTRHEMERLPQTRCRRHAPLPPRFNLETRRRSFVSQSLSQTSRCSQGRTTSACGPLVPVRLPPDVSTLIAVAETRVGMKAERLEAQFEDGAVLQLPVLEGSIVLLPPQYAGKRMTRLIVPIRIP